MDGDDGLGVKEPGGIGGVIRAHGEVIANGEEGVVDGIAFADELHIRKKPCVTGKIKDAAVKVDDEAAGVAACNAAAMEGQGEFDFAKGNSWLPPICMAWALRPWALASFAISAVVMISASVLLAMA